MPGPPLRLTVRDPQGNQRDVRFTEDLVRVGRSRECELELDSGFVSRFHARFERQNGGWQVADQGSKNGVFVNGTRVDGRAAVRPGDTVRVGDFSLMVVEEPGARQPETSPLGDERTMLARPRDTFGSSAQARATPEPVQPAPVQREAAAQPVTAAPGPSPQPTPPPLPIERTEVVMPERHTAPQPTVPPAAAPSVTAGLSPREQRLLDALQAAPQGRTTAELIAAVWGAGGGDEEMLERLAARVRTRLSAGGRPLEPLPGGGFRLGGG